MYIAEAHALDSRSPIVARGDHPLVEEPMTDVERMELAGKCMVAMSIADIPAVVDRVDDAVNLAYAAWPDRLYLVGKDGRITYGSAPGPFGFQPAELEVAICKELDRAIPEGLEEEVERSRRRWDRPRRLERDGDESRAAGSARDSEGPATGTEDPEAPRTGI